jgi:hypothetical protein
MWTSTLEARIDLHADSSDQIAARRSMSTLVATSTDTDFLTILDPSRYLHRESFVSGRETGTVAGFAGGADV